MRTIALVCAGLLFSVLIITSVVAQGVPSDPDPSFQTFLREFEEGIRRFINGDATSWKQHVSRRDDVTIMGGFGAYEKGWAQVGPRYDWAAARFRDSGATVAIEYLASQVSGDLAYTVSLELSRAHIVGEDKPAPMVLRVTHLFRKEQGSWKLVHRHADHVINKTPPAAVLQK